jgi:hypothetical protein
LVSSGFSMTLEALLQASGSVEPNPVPGQRTRVWI